MKHAEVAAALMLTPLVSHCLLMYIAAPRTLHPHLGTGRATATYVPNLVPCPAVQPIMLYHPGKIASFSRLTLERGIAAVVVGFPATHLLTARARICISASHTRKDLDCALKVPRMCWQSY